MKKRSKKKSAHFFFHRDLSWLMFNERVLDEARRETVPLMERIRFLAIYSSNLDEFYRVRMPALAALAKISNDDEQRGLAPVIRRINKTVLEQQRNFGWIIEERILQALQAEGIHLFYKEPLPDSIHQVLRDYFLDTAAAFIRVTDLGAKTDFFPENNKLYLLVSMKAGVGKSSPYIVSIPSDAISRFYTLSQAGIQYIVFLDDIVKLCLPVLFPGRKIKSCHSFKITRDAELNLRDEFAGNLAKQIEKKILVRDFGHATRFLYEPGISRHMLDFLKERLGIRSANFIAGGTYHNLKDLSTIPLSAPHLNYPPALRVDFAVDGKDGSLFQHLARKDILIHPPYHSYHTVLRFFNEAAIDPFVTRIYVTLYRVAADSRIVNALISAARNGKKVMVFVELKARFDEANNIRWSKQMKAAGIQLIVSIPGLKVHAKLALVKRKMVNTTELFGLLSTGNFNENTAKFYTDHILMTSHRPMLEEAERVFHFLKKRKRRVKAEKYNFEHLLVGHFNLQERFISLIDREIRYARKGLEASIVIKFNNLEDKVMIEKLYEASTEGVKVDLIVRGICCLVPGVQGVSENIVVRRIVDQYLEHGRIFVFHNNNESEIYLGSADWMIRNLYRRIEVCFPVLDPGLKSDLMKIVSLQLQDNCQAVFVDDQCKNVPVTSSDPANKIRSQQAIAEWVRSSG